MDNESSTNPFANGASDEVTCQKGGLLLDLCTANDGSNYKQNGKKTPELFFLERPSNGKMTEDDDLGPETDVDAVDDVQLSPHNNNPFDVDVELHQEKLLDFDSIKESRQETPTPPADEVTGPVGLVPDNVAESGEESEDEWNYYRVEPSESKTETESKQQTNLPVCEKPASLQGITVPSESADNMESQLNPNAAEFIPSPTQQRSIEQILQSDTAVKDDAELMPISSKTEEGILKVPFASDSFGSVSKSEKLPDLLNGQKNDYLSSDPCQLDDIGVGAPTTSDSAEDRNFSDKMTVISDTGNVPEHDIQSALFDQGSLEKKCNYDIPSDAPANLETLPSKLISDSPGLPEFLDTHVHMDDITNVPVQIQESSKSLSPDLQEFQQSSVGSDSAAIAELDQQKELGVCFDQPQELTNLASEIDVGPIANRTIDMEAQMPMLDQDLVENKCANLDNELNKLIDQIPDDPTNLRDDVSSFQPGDKAREPIHISFELQKDIAPEMESQPELVKLNGEDSSLSFDIQESVLEETIHEIDESVGASPEVPVELDVNSQLNLMDGSPRGDMASDQSSMLDTGIKAHVAVMEQTMSEAVESLQQKDLDYCSELEPKVDIQQSLSSSSPPVCELSQELPNDYQPLPLDHPLSVCVFPLDNIKDKQDHFGASSENEFDVLQKEHVTIISGQENESSQGVELNQYEIEHSSDIAEACPKLELESPVVTMTPPPTPLTLGIEDTMPDVQSVLDVTEKSQASEVADSLQKGDSSTEGEVVAVAAAAATAVATAAVAAVAADTSLKKSENKKPAAKKPLPEKAKPTTVTKAPARSKPVPSKTVKSVPTSPTKPASGAAVPKPSPKKLPASAPITKPTKVQSPTTATTGVNRSKANGLAPKPAPSLLKSRPSPGSSPVTLNTNDAGKPSSKRPETSGNKIGPGTLPASRIRPVSAPVSAPKSSVKPPVSKTATTTRPSTASTNGSVNKSKVSPSLPSRPKTVVQSKVTSVKEGKESVNKQISSSRTSNVKPPSASSVTRTVAQSSMRKVESKLVGNSASVTKTSATTTTLKTATSKLGTRKPTSPSVTSSSSSAKTKVSVSSENRESVKEVTSSVITSNEVKCDQAMFENAGIAE